MQVVVQKKQNQIVLELCYVSNRGPMGSRCCKNRAAPKYMRSGYEKMRPVSQKVGIRCVRSRNFWDGRWWIHTRFCSAHCELIYEQERNDAAKHRWQAFLARGHPRANGRG